MYKHLLVSTDGSKLSAKAVTHRATLSKISSAKRSRRGESYAFIHRRQRLGGTL